MACGTRERDAFGATTAGTVGVVGVASAAPFASELAMVVALAPDGRIGHVDVVLASGKLAALRFP